MRRFVRVSLVNIRTFRFLPRELMLRCIWGGGSRTISSCTASGKKREDDVTSRMCTTVPLSVLYMRRSANAVSVQVQ